MKFLENACNLLGKANLPVYTVASVAVFKGIFRPLFTMMDKKEEPETKKYAAVREGATELIAIPTYITMSWLASKLAPAFSPKGKNFEQLMNSSKSTLGFFGVCFAALYAIPKLCNIAMPHVMKALKMDKPKDKTHSEMQAVSMERWDAVPSLDNNEKTLNSNQLYAKPPISYKGGMRV